MKKYKTLKEFYPYYLSEHEHKTTKLFHFIGTGFSLFFLVQFFLTFNPFNILYALLSGYGFAWVSHFFVEHNSIFDDNLRFLVMFGIVTHLY